MKRKDHAEDRTRPSAASRKPYRPPTLTDHGTVAELTRGGTGTNLDSGQPGFTGAGGLFSPVQGEYGE